MKQAKRLLRIEIENRINLAKSALAAQQYSSTQDAATAFEVPASTLKARIAGRNSRSIAHEMQQSLSNTEEITLVRWITRLTLSFPQYLNWYLKWPKKYTASAFNCLVKQRV